LVDCMCSMCILLLFVEVEWGFFVDEEEIGVVVAVEYWLVLQWVLLLVVVGCCDYCCYCCWHCSMLHLVVGYEITWYMCNDIYVHKLDIRDLYTICSFSCSYTRSTTHRHDIDIVAICLYHVVWSIFWVLFCFVLFCFVCREYYHCRVQMITW